MMSITGHPGGPPTRLGVPIADIGGGMFAAYAIVAALFDRERGGEGSYVDVSMLGGQGLCSPTRPGSTFHRRNPGQLGNAHLMIAPYDTFATADGYVNIAVGNNSLWERFCTALGLEPLLDEACFATNAGRSTNREALCAALEPRLKALTTDEVVRRLDDAGVPAVRSATWRRRWTTARPGAQDLILEVEHPRIGPLRLSGAPYHFDGEPVRARRPPPLLGQQTTEILTEVGYSPEEINALIAWAPRRLTMPRRRSPAGPVVNQPQAPPRRDTSPPRSTGAGPGARPEAADVGACGWERLFPIEEDDRNLSSNNA